MDVIPASVTDVARHFSDYVNRAFYGGENFILIRGGKPVAEIRPLPRNKTVAELSGIFSSLPKLSEKEITSFKDDLRKIRKSSGKEKVNPWDA